MKRILLLTMLLFCMLILTSCTKGNTDMFFLDEDNNLADKRMEQLYEALEQSNEKEIKKIFSKNAISKAENIDNSIENLFLFIKGKVISWNRDESPIVFDSVKDIGETKQIVTWYSLQTDEQQYLFLLVDYPIDTISPNNAGVYSLGVLKLEDEDKLTGTLEDCFALLCLAAI